MTRREMLIQEGARKAYKGISNEAVSARVGYARGYNEGYHQALKDVREEVERRMIPLKPHGGQGIILTETIKDHYLGLIDFIDEQNN